MYDYKLADNLRGEPMTHNLAMYQISVYIQYIPGITLYNIIYSVSI